MSIDPTSGPPGTEIAVEGDGCTTKGNLEVVVQLLDTSDQVQDTDTVVPNSSGFGGEWAASLTVPSDTTDFGEWTVTASCNFIPFPDEVATSGRESLVEYDPLAFTVTQPAPEPEPPTEEPPAALPVQEAPTFTG